jgi:hypothetical protein
LSLGQISCLYILPAHDGQDDKTCVYHVVKSSEYILPAHDGQDDETRVCHLVKSAVYIFYLRMTARMMRMLPMTPSRNVRPYTSSGGSSSCNSNNGYLPLGQTVH